MSDRYYFREYTGKDVGYVGELVVYNPDGKSLLAVIPFKAHKALADIEEQSRLARRSFR